MSHLLPIIEQLADARDNQARLEWLMRCPMGILSKYRDTIRNRLMHANFPAGVQYLEAMAIAMQAVRGPDGELPEHARETLDLAIHHMRTAAAWGQATAE